jgi:PAS domain S-box-containing protein
MTGFDRLTPPPAGEGVLRRPATLGRARADGELARSIFDGFARVAAHLFDAPLAFVFLAESAETGLAGASGWPAEAADSARLLAARVLRHDTALCLEDIRADPELAAAADGTPPARFFVAAPIIAIGGARLGAVGIVDTAPRTAPPRERVAALNDIADLIARQLDFVDQAQMRLADIVETSSDWLWETDIEHRFSHFVELHDIFLGDSANEDIGKRRWELPGADPSQPYWAAHLADLEAHRPFRNFEYSCVDALGGTRHLRVSGKPIFSRTGRFLGYRGSASDITDQKRAQEHLRTSEAQFRYLFEKNPNPMWVYENGSMRFLAVNDAAVALYGYSREEFLGMTIFDIRSAEEATRAAQTIPTFPLTGFWYSGVWQHQAKDGRRIDVEVVSDDMIYEGRSAYIVAVRDVSERRRVEAALRESEIRFRQIADSVPGIIWVTDADGRITFLSKAFEDYTGKKAGQFYGQTSTGSAHPEDDVTQTPQYEAAEKARSRLTYEYRVQRHDGEYRWFLDTCVPRFDAAGRFLGYIGMLTDVEDMRVMSEQLHQAQKMQAVGQLTGGVAHDFNNLLTIILGNAELLSELIAEPKLRRLADATRDAAERSASLVQRLLAFSRRQTLQPTVVDVNELIGSMRELLVRTLGEDIDIGFSFAPEPLRTLVDRSQLEAAILNLAVNARDAMPGGGSLTIETTNVEITPARITPEVDIAPGPYVMIAVSDTGSGMDEEVRRHAFEPFFTTKDVGKGSGLGLSMVYGFIKQTGGNVTLYSEIGQGTTIKIYLPRVDAQPTQSPDTPDQGLAPGHEFILLVEDDERVRAYVAEQLRELGYRVAEAANGPAALAMLEKCPDLDLLFTDVVMPGGMNGRQLAEEVLRRRPGLKLLFTTGYTENAIVHQGRLDPGVELLGKPFSRIALARKVRAVLDRRP